MMADRGKVIKGLECCGKGNMCRNHCPYDGPVKNCTSQLARDAMELLKAQEPIEPVEMTNDFYPIGDPLRTIGWECGKCHDRIAGDNNF